MARLTDTIERAAGDADVSVEVLQRAPSASTDPDHPAALALVECVTEVEGAAPVVELCPGVLETRWYAQLGIPALRLRRRRPATSPTARDELATIGTEAASAALRRAGGPTRATPRRGRAGSPSG